jgi:dihydrofolate reductase
MKITLVILQSIDGYLADGPDDDLSWGSKEDKQFFRDKTKEIGTMIMGSATFDNMPDFAFKDRLAIVMTSRPDEYRERVEKLNQLGNRIELLNGTPQDCVKLLEAKNIDKAALIGGGTLNGVFLDAGLITEMYITIAPVLLGKGIKAFGSSQSRVSNLSLLEVKQIGTHEVLFHYMNNSI